MNAWILLGAIRRIVFLDGIMRRYGKNDGGVIWLIVDKSKL